MQPLVQALHGGVIVGVVAAQLLSVEDQRIGGADSFRGFVGPGEPFHHRFFVRNRNAQAADTQRRRIINELV